MIIIGCSLLSLLAIISIVLTVKVLKLRKKIKLLLAAYNKIESLVSLKQDNKTDTNVHSESFIKFLSDSRDSAYEYIEKVQDGLAKFVADVDADISYFNEYGEVLSMSRPDFNSMKNISKSYAELKKLLPEEEAK